MHFAVWVSVLQRVRVRAPVAVRVTVRVTGGLLPTTSHSIFYSRVGQIAVFSRSQSGCIGHGVACWALEV